MSDQQITAEATPAGELRRQILSQCVAKNEREWWAAGTIEKLEFELNAANDRIKRLEEDLSDAYAEMRKQYPVIKAVFDSSVWTKAKEAKP